MRKSKRLAVVARLAYLREQQQLAELHRARNEFERQQTSQNQLQEYRQEYLQASTGQGKAVDASLLDNYTRFVADLDHAVDLQQRQVEASAGQLSSENEHWMALHARRQSLERLVDSSLKDEEREAEGRRERDAEELWLVNQRAAKKK